jgi:cell wall-associated NlpC family hydrolase
VAVAALSVFSFIAPSSADPSRQDVSEARDRLEALNGELSVLTEELNLARLRLQTVSERLAATRAEAAAAKDRAEEAVDALNENSREAYIGFPAELSTLLTADSVSDLSDRMEFLGRLAQADADAATRASTLQQQATWLADDLAQVLEERRYALDEIERRQAAIRDRIGDARADYRALSERYERALAAAEAAAAEAASATSSGGSYAAPTPVTGSGVSAVIAAARSVVGAPYVFGAADPEVGFDCSGLTMWAWANAGVSLPHSSTAQYSALPHIDRSDLQPGDLIFSSYGRLGSGVIDHVALYIGNGQTIAASNPSTGVGYRSIDWNAYVGSARPG